MCGGCGGPEGYPWEIQLVVFESSEVMREVRGRKPETVCGKNSENVAFEWVKSYIL